MCQYGQRLSSLGQEVHALYFDFSVVIEQVTHLMGLNPLKPKQIEKLQTFGSGRDTFVTLPTNYGKSVTFAVLPLLLISLFCIHNYTVHE